MKNRVIRISLVVCLLWLSSSCMKDVTYPDEPQIEFNDFTCLFQGNDTIATKGVLIFTFTDGNGDIGLADGDTLPPWEPGGDYYYNLMIDYYEKQNGIFRKITLDPPFHSRIPLLDPDQLGKAISGYVQDTLLLNPFPIYDTILFETYIIDRSLHKSNVIRTPEIVVKRTR
ncbi:MAG: hypothetical protein FJY10_04820 [Bacteroidetes bacterium]|nr:hypothetical protein [Bacteroidota bacterium]